MKGVNYIWNTMRSINIFSGKCLSTIWVRQLQNRINNQHNRIKMIRLCEGKHYKASLVNNRKKISSDEIGFFMVAYGRN